MAISDTMCDENLFSASSHVILFLDRKVLVTHFQNNNDFAQQKLNFTWNNGKKVSPSCDVK